MRGRKPVVFLHIGAMKTGTTFLQQLMSANKEDLLKAGFLFPGDSWAEQALATRDVMDRNKDDPALRAQCAGKWRKLVDEMLAYDGTASVFSMEFLSYASHDEAKRITKSLSKAEVHVVLTVRDATGAIPAQWQTFSRNGGVVSWPDFARGAVSVNGAPVQGELAQGARAFRRTQGIPQMLEVWGKRVPAERLHVVTVPRRPTDRLELWRRFAEVVGLDHAVVSELTNRTNTSLGQASADLMRRVNRGLVDVPANEYHPTIRGYLGERVLSQRAHLEKRAELDLVTLEFAAAWNHRVREAIRASKARFVGDLDDLPVEVPAALAESAPPVLTDPGADELLEAAASARDGLLRRIRQQTKRIRRAGGRLPHVDLTTLVTDLPTGPDRWNGQADPVEAAVEEVTALCRTLIELRRTALTTLGAAGLD